MKNWKNVKLKDVLTPSENVISILPLEKYRLLGIRLWGEGGYEREEIQGSQTQYRTFTKSVEGNFTFNKIWARNGAVTVIQKQLEGLYVSPEFPVYSTDKNKIVSEWLFFITKTDWFWRLISDKAFGTSGKNRIKPEVFLNLEIPLPPLAEQQRIVARLSALKNKIDEVKILRGEQEKDNKNLLYSLFVNTIKTADWHKMGKVAPLVKRQVELQPNQTYNEVGARSFGKGIFDKPIVNSNDLTWQKPNWIKTGDLLFSNIKAWEGAIAPVSEKDNNKIGSHRYLTFVPNPEIIITEFLCFYFLTEEGLEKVSDASPGSADRNRTLNTKKICNALVPVPTLEMQQKFLHIQAQLNANKQHQAEQMTLLNGIFPSLLNKAFRGEL